ncbi:MAG: mechanosensitive ion channel family protein [Proteobacteria bacterium]|nr:mechanosensitive ion channel family protein [Pseudomonadota bacterium]
MTYYGNTIVEWLIAFGLMLASFVVGKVVYWIFGRWIKFLTRKTKTQLDDLIVDMIEEPIVAVIILLGIQFGLERLNLPDAADLWSERGINMAVALIIAWLVARLYDALHKTYLVPLAAKSETDLDDQIIGVSGSGVKVIAWMMGIVVGLNNAGYDVGAILAGLGIGGLAFALAAQDTVANIFGGITIFAQRPFKVGDMIDFGGKWMTVKEIGLRSSRLEDFFYQHIVTVPNSQFTASAVTNMSAHPGVWVFLDLKVVPETSAEKLEHVLQALKDVFAANEAVESGDAVFFNYTDYALWISAWYNIKKWNDRLPVTSEINLAVKRQLEKLDVKMAMPIEIQR